MMDRCQRDKHIGFIIARIDAHENFIAFHQRAQHSPGMHVDGSGFAKGYLNTLSDELFDDQSCISRGGMVDEVVRTKIVFR